MIFFWVKWLHVIASSVWFGVNLMQAGDIKNSLTLGSPHVDLLPARINRIHATSLIAGSITILSGFAMIATLGGFQFVPIRISIGMSLAFLLFVLEYVLVIGQWKRIQTIILARNDLASAFPHAKKYAIGVGIGHLLRTLIVATMVVQFSF